MVDLVLAGRMESMNLENSLPHFLQQNLEGKRGETERMDSSR